MKYVCYVGPVQCGEQNSDYTSQNQIQLSRVESKLSSLIRSGIIWPIIGLINRFLLVTGFFVAFRSDDVLQYKSVQRCEFCYLHCSRLRGATPNRLF